MDEVREIGRSQLTQAKANLLAFSLASHCLPVLSLRSSK